jgi:regulator of replication initiation timing
MDKDLQIIKPKEKVSIKSQIEKCEKIVSTIEITSQESYDYAHKVGIKINALSKMIETEKKEITAPIKESVKKIEEKYKPWEIQVKNFKKMVGDKMVEYINAENAKKKLEEERLAKRLEKGTMRLDTVVNKLALAEETRTVTNGGMTTVLVIKVTDKTKIPMDYLIVDESKIKKDYHAGITIPGITYENEKRARM